MPRKRSSSAPLTKTFHVYYSKLKRSITTVPRKHDNPDPSIVINSSAYDLTTTTSPDFASDAETNVDVPPDFSSTVFTSHRFFFTSPGRSNSIVESRCTIRDQQISEDDTMIINSGGGIPVQAYSSNPFIDFRRSMQQMVEANDILDVRADHYRKFMHELLLCYLALNATNTHIFIIEAFADVLISLATSPPGYRCSTSYSTLAYIEE